MASRAELLTGIGVGFGLMYLLDPGRGARRRARLRDAGVNAAHTATDAADTTRRDLTNRIVGTAAELRRYFDGNSDIEGSIVGHAGMVHVEPAPNGGTRLHIRMSYNPPGGWFGHSIARAFGVDPKSSLDADLARMKTYLETGRPPHDAARPETQPTAFVP